MPAGSLAQFAQLMANGIGSTQSGPELEQEAKQAIDGIFGERYPARSRRITRTAALRFLDDKVPFAGLVHQDSADKGVYGGMSLMWFPVAADDTHSAGSLLAFVCGTRGLAPDEQILGRPGHARYLRALSRHVGERFGARTWTKQDPTNLAQAVPEVIRLQWPQFHQLFSYFGNHLYALVEVPPDQLKALGVLSAFLDFYAWERGWVPLRAAEEEVAALKNHLRSCLFPRLEQSAVCQLLRERRFVIIQGPPGTGKTRLAKRVMEQEFNGRGYAVQFHPAVTYETFIAGISPAVHETHLGFRMSPGFLVRAVREATHEDFLLVLDEINRADLSRVLGEAIYLFEAREINQGELREIELPQALDDGATKLSISNRLFVLGTMNSADRSIAILDLAVRRRFAFVDLWPDISVVEQQGDSLALEAFSRLQDIFAQYAPSEALVLLPGHSYYLGDSHGEVVRRLRFELIPLLQEYLQEGRLGPCESELRGYIDWLEGELIQHG